MAEKVNHLAGIMAVGHHITSNMLIPPQLDAYSVAGLCSGDCTNKVISNACMKLISLMELNFYYSFYHQRGLMFLVGCFILI